MYITYCIGFRREEIYFLSETILQTDSILCDSSGEPTFFNKISENDIITKLVISSSRDFSKVLTEYLCYYIDNPKNMIFVNMDSSGKVLKKVYWNDIRFNNSGIANEVLDSDMILQKYGDINYFLAKKNGEI